MTRNKIIYLSIFIIGVVINLYNFTDVFGDTAIPKFRPFGTSTTFGDSTNYVTLNKGLYTTDSIKTDKDLIVKGKIVLDTLRKGTVQYRGSTIYVNNDKSSGDITFQLMDGELGTSGSFTWLIGNYLSGTTLMDLDSTNGLTVNRNIQLSGGTQQIKLPSDTASDYNSDDAITLNRQVGFITTKSLTTASGSDYTLTYTNSLITTSSNVIAIIKTNSGAGAPLVRQCTVGSGTGTIIIRNLGAASLNSTIGISVWVWN